MKKALITGNIKGIGSNILDTKKNEISKKFYNIDKITILDKKISNKEKEFNDLYAITKSVLGI